MPLKKNFIFNPRGFFCFFFPHVGPGFVWPRVWPVFSGDFFWQGFAFLNLFYLREKKKTPFLGFFLKIPHLGKFILNFLGGLSFKGGIEKKKGGITVLGKKKV